MTNLQPNKEIWLWHLTDTRYQFNIAVNIWTINASGVTRIPISDYVTLAPQLSLVVLNTEYLAPKIRSMNNRFHSEAKLPWSYDYPLANHITTYKSSTYREMPLFSRLYPPFGYLRKIFPPRGLKFSLLLQWRDISYMQCFYVYIYNYGESGFALKQNV